MLIDLSMEMVGNNTHISSCWINASTPSYLSQYIRLNDNDSKHFLSDPRNYEKGDAKQMGAVPANSISNKSDYRELEGEWSTEKWDGSEFFINVYLFIYFNF